LQCIINNENGKDNEEENIYKEQRDGNNDVYENYRSGVNYCMQRYKITRVTEHCKTKTPICKNMKSESKVLHHNLTKTIENEIEYLTIQYIELTWQINTAQIIVELKTWDEIDKDNDTEPPHNEETTNTT
jgi:hypothetical protein